MIAMAVNGATASKIAAKFKASVNTIERKARALGISIRGSPAGNEAERQPVEIGRRSNDGPPTCVPLRDEEWRGQAYVDDLG